MSAVGFRLYQAQSIDDVVERAEAVSRPLMLTDITALIHAPSHSEPSVKTYEDGLRDGEEKSHMIYEATIKALENSLDQLKSKLSEDLAALRHRQVQCLHSYIESLHSSVLDKQQQASLESFLNHSVPLTEDFDIEITVSAQDTDIVERVISDSNLMTHQVKQSDSMSSGQICARWKQGGAMMDVQSWKNDVQSFLDQLLDPMEARHD